LSRAASRGSLSPNGSVTIGIAFAFQILRERCFFEATNPQLRGDLAFLPHECTKFNDTIVSGGSFREWDGRYRFPNVNWIPMRVPIGLRNRISFLGR
jgi:hypothetical protein